MHNDSKQFTYILPLQAITLIIIMKLKYYYLKGMVRPMKTNLKFLFLPVIVIAVLAASLIISNIKNKIPSNDISVTGNTAGNLNNHGLFCESEGKVYFSNAYDGGSLYSMNADETDLQKLNAAKVSSINAAGNYLYYFMDSSLGGSGLGYVVRTYGVYRSKLNGNDPACLVRDACITMQLAGDYLYYQRYNNKDYTKFYKVKTDKSEDVLVSDSIINPAACYNGIIYFNGTEKDHYLYSLDTRTDTISTVYEGNLWYPAYLSGYIYYMDVSSDYRLCRYSLSDNVVEVLTNDRVDTFNVGNAYIYYQTNDTDAPALMRMRLDGSQQEVVAEGIYENINITSRYVYFNAFNSEVPVYHTPTEGAVNVTPFTAARDAAMQK